MSSHQVTRILELWLQHQSFQWVFRVDFPQDWLVWSPCCPRDSQESSPAPHFKGINSLALCLLNNPALTSVYDYWEDCWFSSVRLLSRVQLFATSGTTAYQDSLSITNSWSLLKLMSIELMMPTQWVGWIPLSLCNSLLFLFVLKSVL